VKVGSRQLFSKREKGKSILDIFKMSIFENPKKVLKKDTKNGICDENGLVDRNYNFQSVMIIFS
jgi:hypothetical protein